MSSFTSASCGTDPIKEVRITPSAKDPLALTVTVQLAEHVASCCVNADEAFVDFQGEGGHAHATFEFREDRSGHQFVARLHLPRHGHYTYRIFAKILGRTLSQEGTYETSPGNSGSI